MNGFSEKKRMEQVNQGLTDEKRLFHGSRTDSISSITRNNFDISLSGKHCACYGRGKQSKDSNNEAIMWPMNKLDFFLYRINILSDSQPK